MAPSKRVRFDLYLYNTSCIPKLYGRPLMSRRVSVLVVSLLTHAADNEWQVSFDNCKTVCDEVINLLEQILNFVNFEFLNFTLLKRCS